MWQAHHNGDGQQTRYQNLSGNYREEHHYNVTEYDQAGRKTRTYTSKSPVD